jgi:hypothetical protein
VEPEDGAAVERLARYIMRPPVSLERLDWDGTGEVRYRRRKGHDGAARHQRDTGESLDAAELLARVLMHIPGAAASPGALLGVVLERSEG